MIFFLNRVLHASSVLNDTEASLLQRDDKKVASVVLSVVGEPGGDLK